MKSEAIQLAQYTAGPCLAGVFMNVMLYGVMLTQTFFYYSTYRRDAKWIKFYVGILFFADTLNSMFNMWWIYNVLVNNFGNVEAVSVVNWLFETQIALTGIISGQVQLFYAWRLRKLSAPKWVVVCISALAVISCLGAIGTAINMAIKPLFVNFVHYKQIALTWLVSSAVCDVAIAGAITLQLKRSRTGHTHTDTVISRIIHITMSNGLLTATFALMDIISYLSTTSALHMAFNFVLCKLYGNSVLTTLNSRSILQSASDKEGMFQATSTSRSGEISGFGTKHSMNVSKISRTPAGGVVVNVETHEMVDAPRVTPHKAVDDWDDGSLGDVGDVGDTKAVAV